MINYTDKEIIRGLKYRENYVVPYLVTKYMPMIKYLINELNEKLIEAEDIFQDALIIIIKKIDKDEFNLTAKFSTYLYAICKNLIEYHVKKNAARNNYIISEQDNSLENETFSEIYDDKLQHKIYKYYFDKLGPGCKKILRMYWLDLPIKEISAKIGFSESYVRKRKHKCKKKLIDIIILNPDHINSD